jgi:hypothetical protein
MTTKPDWASERATDQLGVKSQFAVEEAMPCTRTMAGVESVGCP